MAGENGPARPDIATKPPLPADVRNCNFYVLMEALYRRHGAPGQDISLRTEPAREIVRFSSDASISFPGTDLSALSVARTDSMYCKPGSWVFPAASRRYRAIIWIRWRRSPHRTKTA